MQVYLSLYTMIGSMTEQVIGDDVFNDSLFIASLKVITEVCSFPFLPVCTCMWWKWGLGCQGFVDENGMYMVKKKFTLDVRVKTGTPLQHAPIRGRFALGLLVSGLVWIFRNWLEMGSGQVWVLGAFGLPHPNYILCKCFAFYCSSRTVSKCYVRVTRHGCLVVNLPYL